MKKGITSIIALAICTALIMACTKESGTIGKLPAPQAHHGLLSGTGIAARPSGADYSQSIPIDTANRMITSYLTSVGYPSVDTALRALSFDADTLRAYLSNPNIVTVKFMVGHQQAYMNSGKTGRAAGMNPAAITFVLVGLNSSDQYVRNSQSGVYDHFSLCPYECPSNSSTLIQ